MWFHFHCPVCGAHNELPDQPATTELCCHECFADLQVPPRACAATGARSTSEVNCWLPWERSDYLERRERLTEAVDPGDQWHIKPIPGLTPDNVHLVDSGHFDEIELRLPDPHINAEQLADIACRLCESRVMVFSLFLPWLEAAVEERAQQVDQAAAEMLERIERHFRPVVWVTDRGLGRCKGGPVLDLGGGRDHVTERRFWTAIRNLDPTLLGRELTQGLAVDVEVGRCLVTGAVPFTYLSPAEVLKNQVALLSKDILIIHASDVRRPADGEGGAPRRNLPLGQGELDWAALSAQLRSTGESDWRTARYLRGRDDRGYEIGAGDRDLRPLYPERLVLDYAEVTLELLDAGIALWNRL